MQDQNAVLEFHPIFSTFEKKSIRKIYFSLNPKLKRLDGYHIALAINISACVLRFMSLSRVVNVSSYSGLIVYIEDSQNK